VESSILSSNSPAHPAKLVCTKVHLLAILLIYLGRCQAQSQTAESQIAAMLQRMERAEQTGDANAWIALWSREKAEEARPLTRPWPEARYRAYKIFVQGDEAAVLAQVAAHSFVNMTLHKEDGEWKIRNQVWRQSAADANSVYALLPPEGGAFPRAGSPWDKVAPGLAPKEADRLGWQLRAVFDESYLYIRIEAGATLPAPGSAIEKSPTNWPVLKITAAGAGEFVLYDAVNIGDKATFDKNGKANSHRPFAAYMIRLERNDREVFSASADLDPNRLIDVTDRFFEMRIPLRAMGVADSRATKITVGDAQWPKSVIVSLQVPRYPR
jgi:hypothetical protein